MTVHDTIYSIMLHNWMQGEFGSIIWFGKIYVYSNLWIILKNYQSKMETKTLRLQLMNIMNVHQVFV